MAAEIILDAFREADAEMWADATEDPDIRAAFDLRQPASVEKVRRWIQQANFARARGFDQRFAIRRVGDSSGGMVGWLRLRRRFRGTDVASVELWVIRDARRHGVAEAALRAACAMALQDPIVPYVEVEVMATNKASRCLTLKVGFKRVRGHFRRWVREGPKLYAYRLSREET